MATQTNVISPSTSSMSGAVTGSIFGSQLAAVFLMAAGWGWNAGNFVQPVNTPWGPIADFLHVVPLAILLPLCLRYVGAALAGTRANGARNGITILASIAIVACAVMIVLGAVNPDPNSVGVHTPEDWMPVIVLNVGTLLWLWTQLPIARRTAATSAPEA